MNSNTVLNLVRDTARRLNMPQSVVAANWKKNGMLNKTYSATRNVGITRAEYKKALIILNRLANTAN